MKATKFPKNPMPEKPQNSNDLYKEKYKRMKNIILLSALFLLSAGCSKDFLNTSSTSSYDESFVFSTTEKAYAALNGIHRSMVMQYSSQQHYGGYPSLMIVVEMLGDDVVLTSNGNGYWINEYQWKGHRNVTGVFPFFGYHLFYKLIANANMLLENTDAATGPESDKKMIKGQAYAYRAFSYFWLTQLYGERYDAHSGNNAPAVSLVLSSTAGKQPRSSVAVVYSQIIKDLDNSIALLESPDNTFVRPSKCHFTAAIVKGLRARVALTMQDWETAKTYASEAIRESGCSFMTAEQYRQGFNKASNPEWLWAFEQTPEQSTYYHGFMAVMSYNCNATQIRTNPKAISKTLYEQIPDSDIRKDLWDPTGKAYSLPAEFTRTPYMNRKFKVADASSSVADICFMRLSELYLILAEAKANLNEADAADTLYSLVHSRDPQYRCSASRGEDLLREILLQRRIELWGEGFRFLDLKRLNQPLDRRLSNHKENLCKTLTVMPGDKSWQFLIPQKELTANDKVEQNPL